MDSKMQASQRAIGASSDVAQLALSYYFDRTSKGIYDEETQQIYENIIILAVLAQIAIDGCKKQFSVDPMEEVKRIRRMSCMKKEKDYPRFMEYTHAVALTKNGVNREYDDILKDRNKLKSRIDYDIVCPMNWVEDALDNIKLAPYLKTIPITEFFIWEPGKAKTQHLGKARQIVEEYSDWVKQKAPMLVESNETAMSEYFIRSTEVIEQLRVLNMSRITMNHLIGACLNVSKRVDKKNKYKKLSKYSRKMLNFLYKANKELFLSFWVKNNV